MLKLKENSFQEEKKMSEEKEHWTIHIPKPKRILTFLEKYFVVYALFALMIFVIWFEVFFYKELIVEIPNQLIQIWLHEIMTIVLAIAILITICASFYLMLLALQSALRKR